jgi:restriction system protein
MSDLMPLLALAAALLAALAAFFALGLHRRQRLAARIGISSLHTMKWREFAQLVGDVLRRRGFEPVRGEERIGEAGFDFKLERGNQRYLALIKHGRATRVSESTLRELRAVVTTEGAAGGIVVTSGRVDAELAGPARVLGSEVLHGETLWTELLPLLSEAQQASVQARVARAIGVRWFALALFAVLAGGAIWLILAPPAAPPAAPARTPVPAAPVVGPEPGAVTDVPAAAAGPASPMPFREVPVLTEEEALARRMAALTAVRALEGVEIASWATRSTLLVVLASADPELRRVVADRVCERLVEFEELRYTRLQIQETEERVRWAQCQ